MLIPALFFWCVCKRDGVFLLFGYGLGNLANGIVKLTACVYRPWIKDPSVNSLLKTSATGYSFPSGHTTDAVVLYGGTGAIFGRKHAWIFWIMLVPILLLGFARNWLGCHTPQDVVVGLLMTAAIMVLLWQLMKWLEKHPSKDLLVAGIGLVVCVATLIYVMIKPYPVDYAADGSILVDPIKMWPDTFASIGFCIGMFCGWIVERRAIRFSLDVSLKERIVRGVLGFIVGYILMTFLLGSLEAALGSVWGTFCTYLIYAIYIFIVFPACIKLWDVCGERRKTMQAEGH